MFHLLGLAAKVGILALIVLTVAGYILVTRVEKPEFREGLRSRFSEALNATSAKVSGFQRIQGTARVYRVGAEGSQASFFESLEVRNLQFKMGWFDGLGDTWDAGVIEANTLDAELRAGFNSREAAEEATASVFDDSRTFRFLGLTTGQAHLTWGYFERAFGEIVDSRMTITRSGKDWRCSFEGGRFSQNWIRGFGITKLVVLVREDGLEVEEGLLESGGGSIAFRDVKISAGMEPRPSGRLVFTHVRIDGFLPRNASEVVTGTISGEFELGGSSNTSEGITFAGRVQLGYGDRITVRRSFHLFNALDVVDAYNSYKRVDFDAGGFELRTGGGEMKITGLDLTAGNLMSVSGDLTVRRPSDDEIEKKFGQLKMGGGGLGTGLGVAQEGELELSLERAGLAVAEDDGAGTGRTQEELEYFDALAREREVRRVAMDRARALFLFDGNLRISLVGDAFERKRLLRERYPMDPATGRILIELPLEGSLAEISIKQAEEILRLGADE